MILGVVSITNRTQEGPAQPSRLPARAQGLAWAGAIRESEERARNVYAAALDLERRGLARTLEDFTRQRAAYF